MMMCMFWKSGDLIDFIPEFSHFLMMATRSIAQQQQRQVMTKII